MSAARRNLVLARVGAGSLHGAWLDPAAPRNWDLRLVPYQEMPDQSGIDCGSTDVIPGPKWTGLRIALNDWDGWREYDQIWLPDDDIQADQDTVNRMFDVAAETGLDLFAPALQEASHFAHFITMRHDTFFGRWVGFVEIMMPGFSRQALERLLPTFELTQTGWGWGLDSVWPKLLDYENVGIIDATPVLHTRPVGEMRDEDLRRRVHAESDALLERFDCSQRHVTFAAFGADGKRVDQSPERLLAELVKGAHYLIERDPRVLSWIVDFQKPHFTWQDYPVEGTP